LFGLVIQNVFLTLVSNGLISAVELEEDDEEECSDESSYNTDTVSNCATFAFKLFIFLFILCTNKQYGLLVIKSNDNVI